MVNIQNIDLPIMPFERELSKLLARLLLVLLIYI